MDDFPGDASTNGLYTVRDKPILGFNEDFDDVDWIRIEGLKPWHFYNVWFYSEEVRPSGTSLKLVDSSGELIDFLTSRFPARGEYQHTYLGGQSLFLEAARTGGDYKIFIREEDDAADTFSEATNFLLFDRDFHAGAIQPDDIDYARFLLREGVEYTFDLLGADSFTDRKTTLANPLLRIFDSARQLVASDNNSGQGKNARIEFTPTETAEYTFQIVGFESTGSYILESDQFDDFSDNIETTGILTADGVRSSGRSDFGNDNDWFRVSLQEHYTYKFEVNTVDASFARLSLHDSMGVSERFNRGDAVGSGLFHYVEPGESGDRFVEVRSSRDYEIGILPFDVIGETSDDFLEVNFLIDEAIGVIETAGDRDWIRKQISRFGKFRVEAVPLSGQAADTFEIIPRSFDTETVFDTITGSGIFRPEEGIMFFDVGASDGNATGAYRLQFIRLDAATDSTDTQWNVQLNNGLGRIRNALETFDDTDWHRIQLKANTWYEFDVESQNIELDIRKPDGTIVPTDSDLNRYYFSDQEGEHYLITNSQFAGGFQIDITADAKREVESQPFFFNTFDQPGLRSLVRFGPDDELVQVYSELTLRYNVAGQPIYLEPNTVHTVAADIFGQLEIRQRQFVGAAEIFARVAMNESSWSTWASGEIYGFGPSFELTSTGFNGPAGRDLTYAFAETAPGYLSLPENSALSDFSVLTDDQRAVVSQAIDQWNFGLFGTSAELDLVSDPANADVLIYNIQFDDENVHAQGGGDRPAMLGRHLLINSASNVFESDASLSTDRSTFEILRGLGQALGLNASETLSRNRSVMGNRDSEDESIPWPTTPLPEDLAVLRRPNFFHQVNEEKNVYWLGSVNEKPFFKTIVDNARSVDEINIVSAFGSQLPATIDLRGGRTSFVSDGTDRPYNYANSLHSLISDGYGGDGDDVLYGNFLRNKLIGGKGDDYLSGGIGQDSLFGGEGNDRYGFKPGYEQVFINEQANGGTDTLEIEGMFNLDSLQDDLTFQRLGNNLHVRLDWDSEFDANTDTIQIFNMTDPLSQVESLKLSNPEGMVAQVDLISVFTQADGTRRRFEVLAESSEFGSLVAPV